MIDQTALSQNINNEFVTVKLLTHGHQASDDNEYPVNLVALAHDQVTWTIRPFAQGVNDLIENSCTRLAYFIK